jgi:hypothetical protein
MLHEKRGRPGSEALSRCPQPGIKGGRAKTRPAVRAGVGERLVAYSGSIMKQLSHLLVPAVMLAAVVPASDQRPAAAEPEPARAVSGERSVEVRGELRPTQDDAGEKRPAVRVILPSPYGAQR